MSGAPRPKAPVSPPKQRKGLKPSRGKSKTDFHPSVRAEIERRSGGKCEAGVAGCTHRATIAHHIRRRGVGGTGDDAANGLHVCNNCHVWIHANVRESALKGWLQMARYAQ